MRTKTIGYGLLILALSLLSACIIGITIGGNITGLTGTGLVLQNNGGDDLTINADGPFTFKTPLPTSGGPYAVTVKTQPSGQVCTVSNGAGTATAHVTNVSVQCVANEIAKIQLLAGGLGGYGNIDGTGAAARFSSPYGIVLDSAGNAYVTDSYNHTIRKISPAGVVTTLAGLAGSKGIADGTGAAARFNNPSGIALDSTGNAYVTDSGNHTIRKISPSGEVTTLAGAAGSLGGADGTGATARFNTPRGIAVDSVGNVYVVDTYNHDIRKISPAGVVTTLAGAAGTAGSTDGAGLVARFKNPTGIGLDGAGNAYVADTGNYTIRKISPTGAVITFAGTAGSYGSGGTGAAVWFNWPAGLALDSADNVYVTDGPIIRKVSPTGAVITFAGTVGSYGSADGFNQPMGIAIDGAGNAYVADTYNHAIRKVSPAGGVTTLAGAVVSRGSADGTGASARFYPARIVLDSAGNTYATDAGNNTIRKISPEGVVTTLAGLAGVYGSADGAGTAARFNTPRGIALDSVGNLYVADSYNHSIRKISPTGGTATLAGMAGSSGSIDGIRAAAKFNLPSDIALDSADNVYVTDTDNCTIRKISPAGVVTTLAGTAYSSGSVDGTGAAARFNWAEGIALDSVGNVYVADSGNHTIRKISPAGVVTTLAGTAGNAGSADGTGAAAKFNRPSGITVDSAGNVYVADTGNYTIRKISPAGMVTTVLGSAGKIGVQLGALPASLGGVEGVAVSVDKLYVTSENSVLWAPKP